MTKQLFFFSRQAAHAAWLLATLFFCTTAHAQAPTVITTAATFVTNTTATINGSANPNASGTVGWFRYGTVNPGTCDDAFGTRVPAVSGGASLGSGTSPVSYSRSLTGLTPGTTYYACAIAISFPGNGFGDPVPFSTTAAPVAFAINPAPITGTAATLNGTVNPGSLDTVAWFRYNTTSPGTCNDTFGTRLPASGGVAITASNTFADVSQAITATLTPGATYYVCVLASNALGQSVSAVKSFSTALPPVTTTLPASFINIHSANMNATVNPRSADTQAWFRYYNFTEPLSCTDSGSRVPSSTNIFLPAGTSPQPITSTQISGPTGGTFFYCAISINSEGTTYGAVMSVGFGGMAQVTTQPAVQANATTVTLNGLVNPMGQAAFGYFRYGTSVPTRCDDSYGTRVPEQSTADFAAGSGSSYVPYGVPLAGYPGVTTIYICAMARNAVGTTLGAIATFVTPVSPPSVVLTTPALSLTGATLKADVINNGASTTVLFRYSTTSPGACNASFGTGTSTNVLPNNPRNDPRAYAKAIAGLTQGTTYYYCLIATNSAGTTLSPLAIFTTPIQPVIFTPSASNVTNSGASLNAAANPAGSAATGWFRYDTVSPGVCNDTFGTRAPAIGIALGAGNTPQGYSQNLAGLAMTTTYYFCAIVSSAGGTVLSSLQNFTTTATALPGAPAIGTAIIGNAQATVSFTAPTSDGGSPIIDYAVTCDPGNFTVTGTASPVLLDGLVNGLTFTCLVRARNSVGLGLASATISFTPQLPPVLLQVVSRKTHGAAGPLAILIPPAAQPGDPVTTDSRAIGAGHTIVFQFDSVLALAGTVTAIDAATSSVFADATSTLDGNDVVVTLPSVPDNSRVTIAISGVNGYPMVFTVSMGFLMGDVNNSRAVDGADLAALRTQSGQVATQANARLDLNVSGVVSASDLAAVKARVGKQLP